MTPLPLFRPLPVMILFLLASCAAPGHWENPKVPPERWAADREACRTQASATAEKNLRPEELLGRTDELVFRHQFQNERYRAQRRAEKLYKRCLMHRGYTWVTSKKDG